MLNKFLLFCFIAITILESCSNSIKVTQTPDDVYYSPVRGMEVTKKSEPRKNSSYTESRTYVMSRHDRRWRDFNDDYNYRYDPYHYGYNYGYYYNPYYYPYPVYDYGGYTFSNPKNTTPRTTNLSSYQFQHVPVDPKTSSPIRFNQPVRHYNNSNYDFGNVREIISPRQSGSGSDNGTRSYSPSSSGNNSGSGSSIVRPHRN